MITNASKPALDVSYQHKGTAIELVADIAAGWSRGSTTYEYVEHTAVDFTCDHMIKVELSVVPVPRGFQSDARKFPGDQESGAGDDNINYVLWDSLLTASVKLLGADGRLNPALPWKLTETGRVALEWVKGTIAQRGSTFFELRVHLVFNPPLHATAVELRDWRRRYLPDGFPVLRK
jgi:hypothetical protein